MSIFHQQQLINELMLKQYPLVILILSAVVSSLLLNWFITKFSKTSVCNKKNLPPSPPKLPILGNLHQLGPLPHYNLHSLSKKYGPLMLLHFGSLPTLIVSSADAAREIMKTHDLTFADRPQSSVGRRLLYDGKDVSIAPYGEYWRQLKSICVLQLLSNKRVQSFHSIREEETTLLMNKIRRYQTVNLSDLFTGLTNDVVCRCAFGSKLSKDAKIGNKIPGLLKEFMGLLGNITIGNFVPCLRWINQVNGFDARVDKVAKQIDDFFIEIIQERLEKNPPNQEEREKSGENFIDILLGIYQNNDTIGVSISMDSIKAILLDVFVAGTDTTATVLEWAMAELLRNPRILQKLQVEIKEIVKDKKDITDGDLENMHYLKAVIKETLRHHTPIPLLVPRVARADVKVKGYDILAGTMTMINAWAIARDPSTWNEPEEFKPERFLNSSVDYKGLDFELIPFGAGRRGCPGISFAVAIKEFVLANLVHTFDWSLPDGALGKDLDMTELPGVSIRMAIPLRAIATPR